MLPSCVEPEEVPEIVYLPDNPMNQTDRDEIGRMIKNARPRVAYWLKESLAVSIVVVASGAFLHFYLPDKITSQTSAMATDVGALKESVGTLKTDIADIKKDIKDTLNRALDRAFATPAQSSRPPEKRSRLELGNTALELAGSLNVVLDPTASNRFGLYSITTASDDSNLRTIAWHGVTLALAQRSTQPDLLGFLHERQWYETIESAKGMRDLRALGFYGIRMFGTEPDVPLDRAWLMVTIGTEREMAELWRKNVGTGRAEYGLIVGTGSPTFPLIDGTHIRNVIFQNVTIVYRGGPLILENVGFVKCKFDLLPETSGLDLAKAILKQTTVTFTNST